MSDRLKDVGELAFEHIDSEPSRDLWRVRYTRTLSCDHEPTVLTSWYSSEPAANAEMAYQASKGAVNITVHRYTHDAERQATIERLENALATANTRADGARLERERQSSSFAVMRRELVAEIKRLEAVRDRAKEYLDYLASGRLETRGGETRRDAIRLAIQATERVQIAAPLLSDEQATAELPSNAEIVKLRAERAEARSFIRSTYDQYEKHHPYAHELRTRYPWLEVAVANAELLQLAEQYPAPQEWYDEAAEAKEGN